MTDAVRFFPILMTMSLSSATQDIASDGWAVEHLTPEQQAFGNAIQAGAVAFGVLTGGSGTLLLVDILGWQTTLLVIAALSGGGALPFLLTPEAQNRRPLPADYGSAGFGHFLSLPMAGAMLTFAFLFRMARGWSRRWSSPSLSIRALRCRRSG